MPNLALGDRPVPLTKRIPVLVIVIALVTVAASLGMSALVFSRAGFDFAFFVFLMGLVAALAEFATWDVVLVREYRIRDFSAAKTILILVFAAFAIGVLGEILTLFGAPTASVFHISDWRPVRIWFIAFFSYLAIVFLLWFFVGEDKPLVFGEIRQLLNSSSLFEWMLFLGLILAAFACASCAYFVFALSFKAVAIFCLSIALIITAFVFTRKIIGQHPEYVVFAIAFFTGAVICIVPPAETGIAPDDQAHYYYASSLSYVVSPEMTLAEEQIRTVVGESTTDVERLETGRTDIVYDQDDIDYYNSTLDRVASESESFWSGYSLKLMSYKTISYIPSAMGLWVARLIKLPLSVQFILGKLFNLLFYAWCCFVAVRVTPVRKILFSVILLAPGLIFAASNYTYDSWITGLIAIGLALLFREFYYSEKAITKRAVAGIFFSFALAMGPKPIYFPILCLLLFMPKDKFKTSRGYRLFILGSCCLTILEIASFALPFLATSGSSANDDRGGSGVNSAEQLAFILHNPANAFAILSNHIFTMFLPFSVRTGFVFYGYLGGAGGWPLTLCNALLLFVSITDTRREENHFISPIFRVLSLFLIIATVYLMVLALYISYTAVGAGEVAGVQGRYFFPLLIPLLALCIPAFVRLPVSRELYATAMLGVVCFLSMYCNYAILVSKVLA